MDRRGVDGAARRARRALWPRTVDAGGGRASASRAAWPARASDASHAGCDQDAGAGHQAVAHAGRAHASATRARRAHDGNPRQTMMSTVFASTLLKDKAALVTGGGTGICRGIALAFAAHGCHVAITSRKIEHLEPTRDELKARGVRAVAKAADVRDAAAVAEMIAAV